MQGVNQIHCFVELDLCNMIHSRHGFLVGGSHIIATIYSIQGAAEQVEAQSQSLPPLMEKTA
jgi:hypothetical protein